MSFTSRKKQTLCLIALALTFAPQLAFAGGIGGALNWVIEKLQQGMIVVGAALALGGLVALGAGCWDIIQHYKPENRDNPDQKSRGTSGIVKFVMGGILATGAYQVIANSETFQASIDPFEAPAAIVAFAPPAVDLTVLGSA